MCGTITQLGCWHGIRRLVNDYYYEMITTSLGLYSPFVDECLLLLFLFPPPTSFPAPYSGVDSLLPSVTTTSTPISTLAPTPAPAPAPTPTPTSICAYASMSAPRSQTYSQHLLSVCLPFLLQLFSPTPAPAPTPTRNAYDYDYDCSSFSPFFPPSFSTCSCLPDLLLLVIMCRVRVRVRVRVVVCCDVQDGGAGC